MILAAAFAGGAAPAQDSAQPAGTAYVFSDCTRPGAPELMFDPSLKGRAAINAYNAAVRRFNAHVAAVNEYFKCLGAEADRDLKAYYAAVSSQLEAEQQAALGELDALRAGLRLPSK
jgi:hypothetical protein